LLTDFSAALAFVKDDPLMNNEIFLRNYEERDGREHVFWFGFVIENWPLILTQEWFTGENCTSPLLAPIEVTVENGRVIRYRRIAYSFHSGSLTWKSSNFFPADEFFALGFPLNVNEEVELHVFTEG
jgi:hypothetical protein